MWIDFNGTFFKTEDILYIDKYCASHNGNNYYALKVKTTYIEIIKTYGLTSRPKGRIEREEDYKTLCEQLKEN